MPSEGNPKLSVRIPDDLNEDLDEKAEALNLSRSQVVILALKNLLQPPDETDRLTEVERRLNALESNLARISPDLPQRRH
jgi:predicted transcriptional regulator